MGLPAGEHIYVTTIKKEENFGKSYNSICLAYRGAFLGRKVIFDVVEKIIKNQ
jgi:hypothetical protein